MSLLILFASETGCAQEVAERISRDAQKRQLTVKAVREMDSCPMDDLAHESLVVFVCSTTGQGDPPGNMRQSWRQLLRKTFPALPALHFSVFGLGDSSYAQFNFVAKKLHNRLVSLGANCILNRGLGDDQDDGGLDKELSSWLAKLWPAIASILECPLKAIVLQEPPDSLLPPETIVETSSAVTPECGPFCPNPEQRHPVELCCNVRLTAEDHFQDVRHIEFRFVDAPPPAFELGDVVGILPENPDADVHTLLRRMGWEGSTSVRLHRSLSTTKAASVATYFGRWITLFDLLKYFLDIMGTPRRYWFEVLAACATDEAERERLQYFSSAEGSLDLHSYCHKEKRTYVETLEDFPSCRVPLDRFLDTVPAIRPRLFSISSAMVHDPRTLAITMSVVEFKTPYKRVRRGLCTDWLSSLPTGSRLVVLLRPGSLVLPDPTTPIIMIGPGTGVAPFRAFIQARCAPGVEVHKNNNVLFFGCRYKRKDFLYDAEMTERSKDGKLTLHTAFSRDQQQKVYVQHQIVENGKEVSNLIFNKEAWVFIAGNAKNMPSDVQDAICQALV
eukprot:EG_transcript_8239